LEVIAVPYKPKHPCAYGGCRELTTDRYCEQHRKDETKRYNKYDRDPASNKRYSGSWKQISKAYRQANPLCELCLADGQLVPADLVHHKRKLTDGGTNDRSNLQALCQECHSRLHAERGDYF
jgi:5-methylcytosine-specific restriction protein A